MSRDEIHTAVCRAYQAMRRNPHRPRLTPGQSAYIAARLAPVPSDDREARNG